MQLQEILRSLTVTPTDLKIVGLSILTAVIMFFVLSIKFSNEKSFGSAFACIRFTILGLILSFGIVVYDLSSRQSAIDSAEITRSKDTVQVHSNSRFMKSADLRIVEEKDSYIDVEFNNKTYRINNSFKKGN